MPLLSFWKNNRDEVLKLTIEQIVSMAGDGNLRDGSDCSTELRQFLTVVPSDHLFSYSRYCLESSFNNKKGGLVLQEVVNELGRRLDFEVENGVFQGRRNAANFDGIWRSKGEPDLIIEVKTTDYVTVSLDKLAEYKEKLVSGEQTGRDSSILIVVGREDTGALASTLRIHKD